MIFSSSPMVFSARGVSRLDQGLDGVADGPLGQPGHLQKMLLQLIQFLLKLGFHSPSFPAGYTWIFFVSMIYFRLSEFSADVIFGFLVLWAG